MFNFRPRAEKHRFSLFDIYSSLLLQHQSHNLDISS